MVSAPRDTSTLAIEHAAGVGGEGVAGGAGGWSAERLEKADAVVGARNLVVTCVGPSTKLE